SARWCAVGRVPAFLSAGPSAMAASVRLGRHGAPGSPRSSGPPPCTWRQGAPSAGRRCCPSRSVGPPLWNMLHRFLLTILPSTDLSEKVMALRAALFARIGSFSGRNTPPHITLCFLDLPEAMEPQVVGAVAS